MTQGLDGVLVIRPPFFSTQRFPPDPHAGRGAGLFLFSEGPLLFGNEREGEGTTNKEGNRQNPSLICKVARPIRFDSHDNNSTRLKAIQAQAREKLGLNVCGWKLD